MKKENYNKWKKKYLISNKKDRKNNFQNTIIGIIISFILFYLFFLFWNDEARFFARKTTIKKGIVLNTKFKQRGKAGVYQRVDYRFIYDGKSYETYFWANKITGKKHKGDSIKIKFEINNPKNSKYLSK
jgi:hypothetical protein